MLTTIEKNIVKIEQSSLEYPKEWQGLADKPDCLYAVGNIALLKERKLAIVGSRTTPVNALKLGAKIAEALSSSFVILTGTADGGDTVAIEGALQGGGRVICLLAGGFSALPQAQAGLLEQVVKRGLLLSPHSFETPVRTFSYEYRNKLLAALCEGVLVLGAGEKSGALITAKYAKGYQKPVFALPYPPNTAAGAGCNALIKSGGYLVENAEDIAKIAGVVLCKSKPSVTLNADEEKMLSVLRKAEAHINELSAGSGIPVFKARAVLSALEVKGLVVALGGNRYAVV